MCRALALLVIAAAALAAWRPAQPPQALAASEAPPALADATLHAVRFIDAHEGWAAGDDGLVLHTIDGGKTWERQPTPTRASLRDLHFFDAFTGLAVGREELPYAGGSIGVILYTDDGGVKWRAVGPPRVPGIFAIRYLDEQTGFLFTEASEAQPSGLFETADAGNNWKMVSGARQPGWFAGAIRAGPAGLAAGPSGLMQVSRGNLLSCATPALEGRAVRAVGIDERSAWAAGDRGLVWRSEKRGTGAWQPAALGLPQGVQEAFDCRSLALRGNKLWIAGRPGAMILHSPDGGQTWQLQPTGQPLPLTSLSFLDENRGWAVGQGGVILATEDGGKNWRLQRRGAYRAAALIIVPTASATPLGTIASLGGDDGYLVAVLRVASPDAAAPPSEWITAECRLHEAVRRAGGCAAEALTGLPLPQHLRETDATRIAEFWGDGDPRQAQKRLEQEFIQAIRIWQPDVVVCEAGGAELDGVIAAAARSACEQAGRGDRLSDRDKALGLKVHRPLKLYTSVAALADAQVALDLDNVRPMLYTSASDFAAGARPLLGRPSDLPPRGAYYRLSWSSVDDAEKHLALMQGSTLERGGQARRPARAFDADEFAACAAHSQDRRELMDRIRKLAAGAEPAKAAIIAVEQGAVKLDEDAAGETVFALGQQFVALGQWPQAREVFLMLLDRYPSHRLAAEANRWLIAFGGSSAARRRDELKQFDPVVAYDFRPPSSPSRRQLPTSAQNLGTPPPSRPPLTILQKQRDRVRQWYQASAVAGEVLAVQGPLALADPRVQFALHAAERRLKEPNAVQPWYTQFMLTQNGGPWFEAASSELWLGKPEGPCPKPLLTVRRVDQPPTLDGQLGDGCWAGVEAVPLKDAVGATQAGHATRVRVAYDEQFLYVALQCAAPGAPPARKERQRDDELAGCDRVCLLLDVDRNYATPFRLEVDRRGCAREDCWGDARWNPRWFVAGAAVDGGYQIEAAIPLAELTDAAPKPGEVWAFNAVRILPGRGVQGFSLPADVEPRLEGLGLLRFAAANER